MERAGPRGVYRIALFLDRRMGPPLCGLLALVKRLRRRARAMPPEVRTARQVLVVKFWGLGSLVLASPLLEEIRRRYPHARIDFCTLRENEGILAFLPSISRRLTLDLRGGVLRFLWDTLRLLSQVRRERYDLLFDLEFFTRFSAAFSFLAKAGRTHGFSSKGSSRGRLHDVGIPFNAYRHVAESFLCLLDGVGAASGPNIDVRQTLLLPEFTVSDNAHRRVANLLESDPRWRADRPLVVVNPNAGDMALERRWPKGLVSQLLGFLVDRAHVNVAVTGSPAEVAYVADVVGSSGATEDLIDLSGRISLEELIALLRRAAVFVTNDSGPLHIACAAGTSTVALFGPETPVLYGPLLSREGQLHAVHYARLICSPCMFVHDNKILSCWFAEAECMGQLHPEHVFESVTRLLNAKDTDEKVLRALGCP